MLCPYLSVRGDTIFLLKARLTYVLLFQKHGVLLFAIRIPSPSRTTDEESASAVAKVAQVNPNVKCYGCAKVATMAVN